MQPRSFTPARRAKIALTCATVAWLAAATRLASQEPAAAPQQITYELGRVDQQPELRNRREAADQLYRNYPRALRRAKVGGIVAMRFRILPDGSVDSTSASVEHSSDPRFDATAHSIVRMLRFTPAMVNSEPVAVWVTIPLTFTPAPPRSPLPPQEPPAMTPSVYGRRP